MFDNSIASLLDKVNEGNSEAITELITSCYPIMYKTALGILGDSSDAQDVVQDASLKLIRNIGKLDNVNSFEPWLKRIVRNEALDYLKTAYHQHNVMWTDMSSSTDEGELEYDPADERIEFQPEMAYEEKAKQEIILEVLNDLPVDQRTVLQMYFFDGMKMQEIAEELGVPFSTISGRLQKAKANVKDSVTKIQKRDGIKLYGLSPLSFYLSLINWWKGTEGISVPSTFDFTKVIPTKAAPTTVKAAETVKSAETVKTTVTATKTATAAKATETGVKAVITGLGKVSAIAAIPMAAKIGLGATVVVAAVFGGSKVINNTSVEKKEPVTESAGNTEENHTESGNIAADSDEKPDEDTGLSLNMVSDSEKNVIWHVEPSMSFDSVLPVTIASIANGSVEGYPQDWTELGYTNNAVVGVVNGYDGIWDYDGNILFEPTIRDGGELGSNLWQKFYYADNAWHTFDNDRHNITYDGTDLQGGPGYYYTYYDGRNDYHMVFSKDFRTVTGVQYSGIDDYEIVSSENVVLNNTVGTVDVIMPNDSYVDRKLNVSSFKPSRDTRMHPRKYNTFNEIDNSGNTIGFAIVDHNGTVMYTKRSSLAASEYYPPVINGYLVEERDNNTRFAVTKADTGEQITDFVYEDFLFFEDGYMPVKRNGKWGFIDETGKEVTDFIFDNVSPLYQGLTYVGINGRYGILDLTSTLKEKIPVNLKTCYGNEDENTIGSNSQNEETSSINKPSVTVNVSGLNVRVSPSTKADKSPNSPTQIHTTYTVYETTEAEGYTWYRIGPSMWIASKDNWTTYNP